MNLKERKGKTQLIKKQLTKFDKKNPLKHFNWIYPKTNLKRKITSGLCKNKNAY